ncbi:MAG: UDP-2,4-diacetamido-2,4,6-trideoxy-beta-L-altropyranose hydrolase [Acidobacteriia bacterium]|nr:UDP-2,4-diacetamido-2,4,6-trideoxy-beta-L-altropyranose hydrolase [Terriglobia bacterium]
MTGAALLIRADASATIGTGHIMRCLALAQAWQDSGGDAVFAIAELPPAIEDRLAGEGLSIVRMPKSVGASEDADATVNLARERSAAWVVIDGDRFDEAFLQRVKSGVARVLLIDDFAERESFPADLILNPNLDATEESYRKRGTLAPLLLGEPYVMLRREFTAWRGQRSFPEEGRKILVTLGGSDPENLTPKIAEALGRLPSYEITVIAGPGYPYLRELERAGTPNVRVVFNAANMRERMERADLAVIVGGGTLWELLYMSCVVLSYSRNPVQFRVVQELEKRGAVCNLGPIGDFDGSALATALDELGRSRRLREQMANIGRQVVDGEGATRVLQALLERGTGD